jgi:hypothetical protein
VELDAAKPPEVTPTTEPAAPPVVVTPPASTPPPARDDAERLVVRTVGDHERRLAELERVVLGQCDDGAAPKRRNPFFF